jgi:hypothetical protein
MYSIRVALSGFFIVFFVLHFTHNILCTHFGSDEYNLEFAWINSSSQS